MQPVIAVVAAVASSIISIHVDAVATHRANVVHPLSDIGVGIDSDPAGHIPFLYSPARTEAMLGAGLGTVSARLYTELSIQDWHWNPIGAFSDAQHHQGYWTSSASAASSPIVDSFGYVLPHRGSTRDQGDDDGFSRIDDGDPATYWKSDPYLTRPYTGDPDDQHPQWAVVDFIHAKAVDGIRIHWMNPYATRYLVQFWTGGDAILAQASGTWHTFATGTVRAGTGGDDVRRLSPVPVTTRFVRILMTQSSNTCDTHGSADRRNCLGYAIQDVDIGRFDARGVLHDLIRHHPCGGDPQRPSECGPRQTVIMVSSIDPWHTAADRIRSGQDQPGLDIMSRSVITRGLPMLYAVPLFYSTPANAAAMVAYLRARRYKIDRIEMGEEVDGQYAMPEDYASLYIQFARAIHAVDPTVRLGGPAFQGVNEDIKVWADSHGDDSWFRRFLNYLRNRGHLKDLSFMSYEHYPFRGCDQGTTLRMDLLREPAVLRGIMDTWWADGLPKDVPTYISEVNFANNGGPVPKQIEGALWMADWIGTGLSHGLTGLNHYQYETEPLGYQHECRRYGGYTMFIVDRRWRIVAEAAQYFAARMITQQWLAPGNASEEIYPVTTDQPSRNPAVTAYAARRPDGVWSLMIVNKDAERHRVRLGFGLDRGTVASFTVVARATFGADQYGWKGDSDSEMPHPNRGIAEGPATPDSDGGYSVAGLSITVLRGRIAASLMPQATPVALHRRGAGTPSLR